MSDLNFTFNLPPEKAIEYLKKKENLFSWDWYDTWREAHTQAFTVAKVTKMEILTDIREMVQKSLDQGITLQQFKKELKPQLQAKGWWGKKIIDGKEVQLGSPYRLKTIYETNLNVAYSVGRYKAMSENAENRPFWQYWALLDAKTRKAHRLLHGKVFKSDDPFWDKFYPPNGWHCRCMVRTLDEEDMKDKGLEVQSSEGRISEEDKIVGGKTRTAAIYKDPRLGKVEIPPEWSYNPGKVTWEPELNKYAKELVEQYKKDTVTNTKIAKAIDRDIKKELSDYFKVPLKEYTTEFIQSEEEYTKKALSLAKESNIYINKNNIPKGFYDHKENVIVFSPDVINNSRTGTIKQGIEIITHENIHVIGNNLKDNDIDEAVTILLTGKFLKEKYGMEAEEFDFGNYLSASSDLIIQLMIKHGFNKQAIWKDIENGKLKNTEDFEKKLSFTQDNITQIFYNEFLQEIKKSGLFQKEIEDYFNGPSLKTVIQQSFNNEKSTLKKFLENDIIKEVKIKRSKKLERVIVKWLLKN